MWSHGETLSNSVWEGKTAHKAWCVIQAKTNRNHLGKHTFTLMRIKSHFIFKQILSQRSKTGEVQALPPIFKGPDLPFTFALFSPSHHSHCRYHVLCNPLAALNGIVEVIQLSRPVFQCWDPAQSVFFNTCYISKLQYWYCNCAFETFNSGAQTNFWLNSSPLAASFPDCWDGNHRLQGVRLRISKLNSIFHPILEPVSGKYPWTNIWLPYTRGQIHTTILTISCNY